MPKAEKKFRWNTRYVLLTYSQCGDLSPSQVQRHIEQLGGECIIGRERHADQGIHLHAFCDFGERKFRGRKVEAFDVGGCHPNTLPIGRTPHHSFDYAVKDGDVCAGSLARPPKQGAVSRGDSLGIKWAYIVDAPSADEFWARVRDRDPQRLCCSFSTLERYVAWAYRPEVVEYRSPREVQFCTDWVSGVSDWLHQSSIGHRDERVGKPECPPRPHFVGGLVYMLSGLGILTLTLTLTNT